MVGVPEKVSWPEKRTRAPTSARREAPTTLTPVTRAGVPVDVAEAEGMGLFDTVADSDAVAESDAPAEGTGWRGWCEG